MFAGFIQGEAVMSVPHAWAPLQHSHITCSELHHSRGHLACAYWKKVMDARQRLPRPMNQIYCTSPVRAASQYSLV
jgi:hypothetical protein